MDDPALARALNAWYAEHARDLPWRTTPRDPYRSLVSELMLQQTQVSRVIDRFGAFVARFPTIRDLAAADEQDVLGLWSGLGYYRRARMLHACAKAVVEHHDGTLPSDPKQLKSLPGVGDYTSGAIASIVHDQPVPAVDGNVVRVTLRLRNTPGAQGDPKAAKWARAQTRSLLDASESPAVTSEALMELGATVCTPKNPDCAHCPWKEACGAHKHGTTAGIPSPKARAQRQDLHIACAVVRAPRDMFLVEQRAQTGLWAGMWHPPSAERRDRAPTPGELARASGVEIRDEIGSFTHITTHRNVRFVVYAGVKREPGAGRKFVSIETARTMGLSSAHERALLMSAGPE